MINISKLQVVCQVVLFTRLLYFASINRTQLFQIDSGHHFLESDDIETCKEAIEVSVDTKTSQDNELKTNY